MFFLFELRFRERFFSGDHRKSYFFQINDSFFRKSHFRNETVFAFFQRDINSETAVFFMIVHCRRFQSRERFAINDEIFQDRHYPVMRLRIRCRRTGSEKNKIPAPSGNGACQNDFISFLLCDFPIPQFGFRIEI